MNNSTPDKPSNRKLHSEYTNEVVILEACYRLICQELRRAEIARDSIPKSPSDRYTNTHSAVFTRDDYQRQVNYLAELRQHVYWWKATGRLLDGEDE